MDNKEIIQNLMSKDSKLVLRTIEVLREFGTPGFLSSLIDLLHKTKNPEIHEAIIALLDDIKDNRVVPELLKAIKNNKYSDEKNILIASCWKSGLDFSHNLDIFLDLFSNDEFTVALEAYSVIEYNIAGLSADAIESHFNQIKQKSKNLSSDRKALSDDLISMFEHGQSENL